MEGRFGKTNPSKMLNRGFVLDSVAANCFLATLYQPADSQNKVMWCHGDRVTR